VLDDQQPPVPADEPSTPVHGGVARILAVLEVLICSDYPTQLAIGGTFVALGHGPGRGGHLSTAYVVGVSLVDTAALIGLVLLFLHAHGERPRDVIFGRRPLVPEAAAGLPMILIALGITAIVLIGVRLLVPWLHTVEHNPLQDLLRTPRDAWLFALVVVVAGGIREEIQRAFLLHRFEVWLGGGRVGVIVTSLAFGAGHMMQGVDAALATALLGAFWGVVYLRRRSAIAPMVSHSGFDLVQIVQYMLLK